MFINPSELAVVLGTYGPLGIVVGQFMQVIIAPIPPITPVASGILYGPWYGMMYSVMGAALGSVLAIYLSRIYGRPVADKFVNDSIMQRFDSLTRESGLVPFIILFVLPGFPDDALCFIAGLTKLDLVELSIIASLGRIPGILMLTTTGHSIAETDFRLFLLSSASVIVISVLSVKYKLKAQKFLQSTWNKVRT
ncbi:MAG: hypothetical protein J07AB43_05780 [Candidatus Nanosalina sp. J07AB43]|jgi:Uncharacterized conserved protein|nr:MAG: hypothetical protein J07AB43_05780 [Candidatus Nanosalina sp. J07AB43]